MVCEALMDGLLRDRLCLALGLPLWLLDADDGDPKLCPMLLKSNWLWHVLMRFLSIVRLVSFSVSPKVRLRLTLMRTVVVVSS